MYVQYIQTEYLHTVAPQRPSACCTHGAFGFGSGLKGLQFSPRCVASWVFLRPATSVVREDL